MRAAVILALIGLALAGLVLEAGLRVYAELRAPRYVGAAVRCFIAVHRGHA